MFFLLPFVFCYLAVGQLFLSCWLAFGSVYLFSSMHGGVPIIATRLFCGEGFIWGLISVVMDLGCGEEGRGGYLVVYNTMYQMAELVLRDPVLGDAVTMGERWWWLGISGEVFGMCWTGDAGRAFALIT